MTAIVATRRENRIDVFDPFVRVQDTLSHLEEEITAEDHYRIGVDAGLAAAHRATDDAVALIRSIRRVLTDGLGPRRWEARR